MRRTLFLLLVTVCLTPGALLADSVVPSERVKSHLRVRSAATGPVIGSLRPGQSANHVATQGDWHQVELADGRVGFVSAAWSRLVHEPEGRVAARIVRCFAGRGELALQEPPHSLVDLSERARLDRAGLVLRRRCPFVSGTRGRVTGCESSQDREEDEL